MSPNVPEARTRTVSNFGKLTEPQTLFYFSKFQRTNFAETSSFNYYSTGLDNFTPFYMFVNA